MQSATLNPRKLVRAREAAGLTQEELAKKVGVTNWAISKLETGARQPSARMFNNLCRVLGVARDDLITRASEAA